MTRVTTQNLPGFLSNAVGFDILLNDVNRLIARGVNNTGYPPYNIAKLDEKTYVISIAVAGFAMDNLEVIHEGDILTITGTAPAQDETVEYLHRGLAGRSFKREFCVAEYVEVVGAKLDLGVLNITLEHQIPEELLPKRIEIK